MSNSLSSFGHIHGLIGLLGFLLYVSIAAEAFEVMLLPRRVRRSLRFVRLFFRGSWGLWSTIARGMKRGSLRDAFLSLYGPLSMIVLLSTWAAGMIFGLGLLHWALQSRSAKPFDVLSAVYFSGSSFFTVGYGDFLPTTTLSKFLAVFEAFSGLAFMAVTIGYLPVLYQLFSQRETLIIKLDARAGSPPTAVALLCRHGEHQAIEELQSFLLDWEQWCTVLVESHLSYPMLSYYRSQHDNQSWLAALTAVLDCCALLLTGFTGIRTFKARMTFAVARLAIVELCRVFHLRVEGNSQERLTTDDFEAGTKLLLDAGFNFSDETGAEENLRQIRATYEPFLFALSKLFLLDLPGWLPSEAMDNWQRSSRGRSAKKLVEAAPTKPL